MKLHGKQLIHQNHTRVTLHRGSDSFDLVLAPLPPAWYERMRTLGLVDYPAAPKRPVMVKGVPVRNKDTGMVELYDDEDDPKYRDESLKVSRRIQTLKLVTLLRDDPNTEFDAVQPAGQDKQEWIAYADALRAEIGHPEHGLTDHEIAKLIETGDRLEARIDVEGAVDDFLPETL